MNYFDVDAMSASVLKMGNISMLAMKEAIEGKSKPSAAMNKGTLRHEAVLEPAKFNARVVAEIDLRTKAGKELVELHGKENIIKPYDKMMEERAVAMVMAHPVVKSLGLLVGGESEKEIYWRHELGACKCKIDWLDDSSMAEFKTTANLGSFAKTCANMSYQLQLAWYAYGAYMLDGKDRKVYVVAQEINSPLDVAVFEVPTLMLAKWYDDCINIWRRYCEGDRSGRFNELMTFELPAWAEPQIELDAEEIIEF